MLSTLNLKSTDVRDRTDGHENEDVLVARIEEQLSKLAHDAAGKPATASGVMNIDVAAGRPVPPIEATVRPAAADTVQLPELAPTDAYADPHDFVPVALAAGEPLPVGEPAPPANDIPRLPLSQPVLSQPAVSLRIDQRLNPTLNPPRRLDTDVSAARPVPPVDPLFRPGAANTNIEPPDAPASLGQRAGRAASRAFAGFVLALIGVAATYAWQTHGDRAERIMAKWMPQSVMAWLPQTKTAQADQPNPQPVEATAAPSPSVDATPPQAAPVTQAATPQTATAEAAPPPAAPQDAAPPVAAPAALPPEAAQQLQAMARDLAAAQQQIEQLKASQDQMARQLAKVTEENSRRRVAAPKAAPPPPRPVAGVAQRTLSTFPPPPPITRQPVSQYPASQQPISQQPMTQRTTTPQTMAQPSSIAPPSQAAVSSQTYPQVSSSAPRPPMPLSSQSEP